VEPLRSERLEVRTSGNSELLPNGHFEHSDYEAMEVVSISRGETGLQRCANCGGESRPVSRKTVLLMLKPEVLAEATTGMYSFCSAPDCPIVYFAAEGSQVFTTDDLRVLVGLKAKTDPIPLCYCFGFDEKHVREEISLTGATTVPQTISGLIREGLCACESRNPSGVCCLGEVNRTVRRVLSR
jgi:Zinc binding domain